MLAGFQPHKHKEVLSYFSHKLNGAEYSKGGLGL